MRINIYMILTYRAELREESITDAKSAPQAWLAIPTSALLLRSHVVL
jgi:hypothetical protein